jgi:hypothetical protein
MTMFSAVAFCFEISQCAVDGSCSATMKTCSKFTVGHHHDVNINLDYMIVDVENLTGEAWVGDSNSSTSSSNYQHTSTHVLFHYKRMWFFSHKKLPQFFVLEKPHSLVVFVAIFNDLLKRSFLSIVPPLIMCPTGSRET